MRSFFADPIDEFVGTERSNQRIAGLSVAVVRGGKVIKVEGYGQASVELAVPAKPETVYQLASVTKQFIASAILLLQQEGQLTIGDLLTQHLPETPPAWEKLTLRHLLTHTSGLVRDEPMDLTLPHTEGDAIRLVKPLPLRFSPGEKWEYCNFGYVLLGEVIRLKCRQRWDQFLEERFFRPLGMASTRRHTLRELVPNRATGHGFQGETRLNVVSWSRDFASGGLLTTVLDLAKWEAALRGDRLLKAEARAQLFEPIVLNSGKPHPYGLGWSVSGPKGKRIAEHGGSRPGFATHFWRELDGDLAVIVLSNQEGADVGRIARGIAPRL